MTALLEITGAGKKFGGLSAVASVSFSLHAGENVGLLGPNGSGKTTMLNMISGAVKPSSGCIRLNGQKISALPPHRISHLGIARTFQLVKILPSLTLEENVVAALAFGRNRLWGEHAHGKAMENLRLVGLGGREREHAEELTYIDSKRLELARALAGDPSILLLDEWLSGLNPAELQTGIELISSLRNRGMTILLVEHIMGAVRALCSRCIVMNAGEKIADGPTNEVLGQANVVTAYLGESDA